MKTPAQCSTVALYVIGADRDDFPVKVGYSRKPESRLSALQMGIWFYVHVLHVRYVPSEHMARKVEKEAHRILSAAGKGLLGEWFDVTPEKALEAIEWAALTVGADLEEIEVVAPPPPRPAYVPPPPPTDEEKAAASRARQQRREVRGRY